MDRVNASEMGMGAVDALLEGKFNIMVGKIHRNLSYTPFEQATKHHIDVNPNLLRMIEILSL